MGQVLPVLFCEVTTPAEFARFLQYGVPGQTALYHVGFLALDNCQAWKGKNCQLPELRRSVWMAQLQSRVHLTQRKLGAYRYEYRCSIASAATE